MKVKFVFNKHNWFVGFQWNSETSGLLIFPLPTLGLSIQFKSIATLNDAKDFVEKRIAEKYGTRYPFYSGVGYCDPNTLSLFILDVEDKNMEEVKRFVHEVNEELHDTGSEFMVLGFVKNQKTTQEYYSGKATELITTLKTLDWRNRPKFGLES